MNMIPERQEFHFTRDQLTSLLNDTVRQFEERRDWVGEDDQHARLSATSGMIHALDGDAEKAERGLGEATMQILPSPLGKATPQDWQRAPIHDIDLANHAESAHHEIAPFSAKTLREIASEQGYQVEFSAKDVGLDRFELTQFKEVPGVFASMDNKTLHVSGNLPEVVRDIADAQVLRETGEIDPRWPIFNDLHDASLQRDEQAQHISAVTSYLQEIETTISAPVMEQPQPRRGRELSR